MKKNKKLLFLVNNLSFFMSHRLPIAKAALVSGFDVVIGVGEFGTADPKLLKHKNFKVILVPMQRGGTNLFNEFKTFFYIWRFFKKEKPDLVHLISIKPYLYGGIIARLMSIPSLVSTISGLGTLFTTNNLKNIFLRLLLYYIYKLTFAHSNQKIIVQNNDDLKLLVKWGVLNHSKTKLIKGSGVKLWDFKNFDEIDELPVICFSGRIIAEKGVYEFISAARLLKKRGVNARFYLAGSRDTKNPTAPSNIVYNKMKINSFVKFLGYQKDIPTLYANSHVVCLPSHREGFPKALMEAAAASRAVVTTDVAGCRDAIIPGKTGIIVPVKNPQKLADALQWLIEHPKERIAMGKAGRKLAEKEFSIEKIVKEHLEIYQELSNKII
jgi:glycosyltransferase involved in cell wall biosynthesis